MDKGASCQPVACDACSRSDISAFLEASPVGNNEESINKLDGFSYLNYKRKNSPKFSIFLFKMTKFCDET